ncbi:hypothetical protein IGI04_029448 [Brassica rapa subsp. trilocularis]|uniref:Uncharacterized protein n=1 Tax=Brassica rapa subsp. trilocularis TaxID=1813537 RepID=A0ABQ7LMY5_BRACM|nr:hypothetical protein IGI04_029448 [Brassica rapa subsp. trilocularis]
MHYYYYQYLATAISDGMKFYFGYSMAVKLAWFECKSISKVDMCICTSAQTRHGQRRQNNNLRSCDGKQHGERAAFKEDSFSSSNYDSRRALYNNSAPVFVRGLSHGREEIGEEKCCLRAIRFGVRKYVSNWFLSCEAVPLDDSKGTLELAPKQKAIILHNKVETLPLQSN